MADSLSLPAGHVTQIDINHDYMPNQMCLLVGMIRWSGTGDFRGSIRGLAEFFGDGQLLWGFGGMASAGSSDGTFSKPNASFAVIIYSGQTFRVEVTDDFASNQGSVWQAIAHVYPLP